jgi:hypothetical protein
MTPFNQVLMQARKGAAHTQLSEDLQRLIQTVQDIGKSGELVLKIKATPEKGGGNVVDLEFDVKLALPRRALPKAPFYTDAEGNLHRSDPNQGEMFQDADDLRGRA